MLYGNSDINATQCLLQIGTRSVFSHQCNFYIEERFQSPIATTATAHDRGAGAMEPLYLLLLRLLLPLGTIFSHYDFFLVCYSNVVVILLIRVQFSLQSMFHVRVILKTLR